MNSESSIKPSQHTQPNTYFAPDFAPPAEDNQEDDLLARQNLRLPKISVVVPTYNEAENLPHVLPLIPDWVYEVILVDGLSVDNTVEVAQEIYPSIRVVLERQRGKGRALLAGCVAARGDIIVTIDADGSNDPAEISRFVGALISGADFAKGSRFLQGGGTSDMPFYRKAGN